MGKHNDGPLVSVEELVQLICEGKYGRELATYREVLNTSKNIGPVHVEHSSVGYGALLYKYIDHNSVGSGVLLRKVLSIALLVSEHCFPISKA